MEPIRVYIADGSYLIREGIKAMLAPEDQISVVAESIDNDGFSRKVFASDPDVILFDYGSSAFSLADIPRILKIAPHVHILAMTAACEKEQIEEALRSGVCGHVLKECDQDEILQAIQATAKGKQFYCGKVLEALKEDASEGKESVSCSGVQLSGRELEIIRWVAEGLTNKEIAEKLFLSAHTVMTHRKNIMQKLGINNTAGIVIYAVKENIISPNKFLFASN